MLRKASNDEAHGALWSFYNGDSATVMPAVLPDKSVHFSVYSPPFSSLYTYTPSERDLGNVRTPEEFFEHHAFIARELLRVMLPGRVVVAHTQELQLYGTRDGRRARYDFPGAYLRHMEEIGFNYVGRITINKNPQTQAIRNHPVELLFATLHRDSVKLVPAQADYLLIFQTPGENTIPVPSPVDDDTWIKWAHPVWTEENGTGILETATLPDAGSKENDDERHLCPLQLPVIERCIRLWTNPGERVFTPFGGIGSEIVSAVKLGRYGIGSELKPAYWRRGVEFCRDAEQASQQPDLFSLAGISLDGRDGGAASGAEVAVP